MKARGRLLGGVLVASAAMLVVSGTAYALLLGCASAPHQQVQYPTLQVPQATLATPDARIVQEQGAYEIRPGGVFTPPFWIGAPTFPTAENYQDALAAGAQRIRISHPGYPNGELYGVIAFYKVYENFHGPASRLYRLEIPQVYVDNTDNGRASVVYETYNYEGKTYAAWAIWLSRVPLPGPGGAASPGPNVGK
jgi:hypothetical protein